MSEPKSVRAVCPHDCPDTCSMLVTVEDGRAIRMAGDPEHPFTQGFLCAKVSRYIERTYHDERLLHPLIRDGAKGEGKFKRASWDEALALVAERLNGIIASADGPEAILPYSYGGTLGLIQGSAMDHRFFHRIGASLLARTICATAGMEAFNVTYGTRMGTDSTSVDQARLILLWGTNTLTSNPHLWPYIRRAHEAGARTICIDPIRTRTAEACDEHLAIRPGTDAALALSMMHVIFRDGLENRRYLEAMAHGWEEMRERVLTSYTPERVAAICRLAPEEIERLAHLYATTSPSFIRLNYGLQRHGGGGNAVRAISLLPVVTGAWEEAGGGCQLSTSATFPLDTAALERHDLIRPGTRTINMSELGMALTRLDDPPVKALVVFNSNPAAVAPDLGQVRRGLLRDDLFTLVLEHFHTDTCDYADVILPATTQLEHLDLHKSYGHLWLQLNQPAIAPVGEALPNSEIFRRIASRMGLDDPLLQESDESMIRAALAVDDPAMEGITLEALADSGPMRLRVGEPHLPFRSGTTLSTPSGKIEFRSAVLESRGLDPLPDYVPPHESEERDPGLVRRFPLSLISPPAHTFLNSTFVNVKSLRRLAGEPMVMISASDAASRSVSDGAMVEVLNDRGAFSARAIVSDRVRPGVVAAPSVWWVRLAADGRNANDTTSQRLTDLGEAATFYDNQVEIRPL
jgi:anaerobic selenocysteine-containing dehydrogenase